MSEKRETRGDRTAAVPLIGVSPSRVEVVGGSSLTIVRRVGGDLFEEALLRWSEKRGRLGGEAREALGVESVRLRQRTERRRHRHL